MHNVGAAFRTADAFGGENYSLWHYSETTSQRNSQSSISANWKCDWQFYESVKKL